MTPSLIVALALALTATTTAAVPDLPQETRAGGSSTRSQTEPASGAYPTSRTYVGTSPCGDAIRQALVIAPDTHCDLVSWKLIIYEPGPPDDGLGKYDLLCSYGSVQQGKPGIANGAAMSVASGSWRAGGVTRSRPWRGYILDSGLQLAAVNDRLLHFLDSDGHLMVGDGGWSYTLNSLEHRERKMRRYAGSQPDMSYPISAVATGPTVFGVFEGRTPCQGIARQLRIAVPPQCEKAKWRVTLFQDAHTSTPTRYKVEGSLQITGARVGRWSAVRGTPGDPQAVVYELAPPAGAKPLRLLKGDDNVLFFVDEELRPRLGDGDFSYTLNRRFEAPRSAANADRVGRAAVQALTRSR